MAQIGQALLEAQKAGIVHRDVSPKNILIGRRPGDVKVINFPLAKPMNDKASGVAAYLSPEQVQGKPVDQRSNTYSLAAVFYHLITGEPPFQGTPETVLELHVSSPPLAPSQRRPEAALSPEVDRVVLKALDKSSSRRHLTLRLFLSEVDALVAPEGAPGARAPPPARTRPTVSPGPCCSPAARPRWRTWWPRPSPRAPDRRPRGARCPAPPPAAAPAPAPAARQDHARRPRRRARAPAPLAAHHRGEPAGRWRRATNGKQAEATSATAWAG